MTLRTKRQLALNIWGSFRKPGGFTTTTSRIFDISNNLERYLINKGDNIVHNNNHTANVHLVSKLDTLGKAISVDVDYFIFDSDNSRNFFTESFLPNNTSQGITSSAINISNQKIENFSAKVDLEIPSKRVHFSYGAKASFTNSKSDVQYFDTHSGTSVLDPSRSNEFNYQEDILAAYISGNTTLQEKLQVQFGLRLENTKTVGLTADMNQKNTNNYTKLFPTLYFSYAKNDANTYGFSYGRRINRPNFRNLNPFRFYINDNSYSVGNPFLQPTFSNNFEFSHSYKRKFNTSISLSIINDGGGTVFTSDVTDQTQIVTRENYYKQYNYTLTESFTYTKVKWWQSQNSVNFIGYNTQFTKDFGSEPKNGVQIYLTSNNTFSLTKNTKLQVNSWYSSEHNRGLFSVGEMFDLSFGLQHSLFKNKVKMSLLFNDVLNTASLRGYETVVNGVNQIYRQNESSRNFRISFSYNFGNKKINVKNRGFGNTTEQRRSN